MDEYRIPASDGEAEYIEKRSRFIGRIWYVKTEEEAREKINEMREKHWDARHNVYAYIIGNSSCMRYSDDGEPQGTGGMPVLEVLKRENMYDICCVVTRYFGGVLLGAGGLTRAYAHSAKLALDAAGVSILKQWKIGKATCPYNLYERIKQKLANAGGIETDAEFGAEITMSVAIPEENTEEFSNGLVELSAGKVQLEIIGEQLLPQRI